MAEKELFIIKIAHKGENKFDILNVDIIFDKVKVSALRICFLPIIVALIT